MAYISSKQAQSGAVTASDANAWTTVCETPAITAGAGNIFRVKAGWHATAGLTGGDVRVVLNDGSTDTALDSVYPVGTEADRSVSKQLTTLAGTFTAKLQAKPAALSSVTIAAYDAWIELHYLTT